MEAWVQEKLALEWSPEQMSGYAKWHGLFSVSHERIYQYILWDKKQGEELYRHLRQGKKRYRKRYGTPKRPSHIKNKKMIDIRGLGSNGTANRLKLFLSLSFQKFITFFLYYKPVFRVVFLHRHYRCHNQIYISHF